MTEITRVPLRPIAKGVMAKFWVGAAAVALLGGGIAWAAMPRGVQVDVVAQGMGMSPSAEDVVFVRYVGKLPDGTVFDEGGDRELPIQGIFPKGQPLPLSQMVPGFREGAMQMQKGGKYLLEIPADKAYGANPPQGAPIPPNSDLVFEIELIDFMSEQDFQQRLSTLQQMMQMQMGQDDGGADAPHGAMPPQPPAP